MTEWIILLLIIVSCVCLADAWRANLRNVDLKHEYKKASDRFYAYKISTKCVIETLKIELKKQKEETEKWIKKSDEEHSRNVRWGYGYPTWGNVEKMIPDGMIEAAKYAMNKSHPDNGGKQEDFIKFRKLYEELKEINAR